MPSNQEVIVVTSVTMLRLLVEVVLLVLNTSILEDTGVHGMAHDLVFFLVSVVNKAIDLLDNASELLLLGRELRLKAVEALHHVIKLLVFLLNLSVITAVKHSELGLELSLDVLLLRAGLILFLTVDSNEVC